MARLKVHDRWTVLPHLAIERLAENLWRVEGSLPDMPLRRVMTLARLGDGRVVVHGAIALAEAEMALVEEWGPPSFLLVPCGCHLLDAKAYRERYPDICVLCPRGARRRVVRVVPVEGDYDAFPPGEAVSLEHLDGVGRAEGAMLVRSDDGTTVVLGDLVSNMPHLPGAMGWFFRHLSEKKLSARNCSVPASE
ncbi:MAG: hypothetical protein HY744_04175 [Deltaproteobacteria bacterium]|nr:hypothetical protein [Deltaproteobacteria bacterium]